jgi:chromosome segregation ATPase
VDFPNDISLWLVGTLLAILSYIGRDMLSKMELIRKDINDLDKNIAVITERIKSHESSIANCSNDMREIKSIVIDLETRIEKIEKVRHIHQ